MLKWITVTANGTTVIGQKHKVGEILLLVSGTFDGGIVQFGYLKKDETFQPLADLTSLTIPGERAVTFGEGLQLAVNVESATSPDILIGVCAEFFTPE